MAYRRTQVISERLAATRERVLAAATALVAEGGWAAVTVSAVAAGAGISTGAVYRHFDGKAALCTEVFRRCSGRELEVLAGVAAGAGVAGSQAVAAGVAAAGGARGRPAEERLARAVTVFVGRALEAPRIAYALLAEPVGPAVEAQRLAFRQQFRHLFADLVAAAVAEGSAPDQDADLTAAALVGGVAETLLGPLGADPAQREPGELVRAVTTLALRTAGLEASHAR